MGYNVSIESALMTENEIVNVTSYRLIPSMLNCTYQLTVSGINDVGLGNSSVMSVSFSHSNVMKVIICKSFLLFLVINESEVKNYQRSRTNHWKIDFIIKVSHKFSYIFI